MELVMLGYPNCSTCKKAQKFLDAAGVAYTYRHIVENNPTSEELSAWIAKSGLAFRKFFNTSGKRYRELNVKARLDEGMTEQESIQLLAEDGMLVKRPLLVSDDFVLVGFKEDAWKEALGLK